MASPQDTCQLDGCKKETTIFCLTCKNYFCLNDYREHDLSDTHRFRRDRRDRRDRRRGRRAFRDRRHRPRCAAGHANHPCQDDVSDHRPTDREVSDFQQLVLRVFNLQAYLRQSDHPFHHITFDNPAIREAHFPKITDYFPTDREDHFPLNAAYGKRNLKNLDNTRYSILIENSHHDLAEKLHYKLADDYMECRGSYVHGMYC